MSIFTAQLHPGRALGFLVLGASLHDIITRLKAEPQRFPKLELLYSPTHPISEPVVLSLPHNGLRLRFDGPEQRLRLVEVLDFARSHITFQDRDLVRPALDADGVPMVAAAAPPRAGVLPAPPAGPTFRHIYHRLLGPTYGGEFIPPDAAADAGSSPHKDVGTYVLSYPGVAFTFPLRVAAYSPHKDVVALLSGAGPAASQAAAASMAIFAGDSWAQARDALWTEPLPPLKASAPLLARVGGGGGGGAGGRASGAGGAAGGAGLGSGGGIASGGAGGGGAAGSGGKGPLDNTPDEVALVRILGKGRLELVRRRLQGGGAGSVAGGGAAGGTVTSSSSWITLGETTPQELVAELGPPDAIYRKSVSDQRMYIHKMRAASSSRRRRRPSSVLAGGGGLSDADFARRISGAAVSDDLTDTDQSSAHTASDAYDSADEDGAAADDDYSAEVGGGGGAGGVGAAGLSGECFYNYFYLGFDVLVSAPTPPSPAPPSALLVSPPPPTHAFSGLGLNGGSSSAATSPSHSPLPAHASLATAPPQTQPAPPSRRPAVRATAPAADRLVATKLVLHGNVPGSYPFNRHRRCRWEIAYLGNNNPAAAAANGGSPQQLHQQAATAPADSETPFDVLEPRLRAEWAPVLTPSPGENGGAGHGADNHQRQRGMVLNRGWGDSPGSSCEFLGGWEEGGSVLGTTGGSGRSGGGGSGGGVGATGGPKKFDGSEDSTTTLYGFPGLVFEVLRNGFVSAVTVF